MNHRSRREFMGLTAGAIAATAFGPAWFSRAVGVVAAAQTGTADLIVVNANVYTVDSRMPKAVAFAVKNSRFIAVGTNDEIRGLAGKGTRTIDAKRMTVVPGFTDCHNHAGGEVLLYEAEHGFMAYNREPEYAPEAARQAFERAVAFFGRYLR